MNKKKEKDLYIIEDNIKRENIITLVMLIFLILATISLIASYVFSILMKNPNLIDNQYHLLTILHKVSLILIIVFTIINTILLFVLIMIIPKDSDYNKYKDYVMISKDELKEYKEKIKKLEIKHDK